MSNKNDTQAMSLDEYRRLTKGASSYRQVDFSNSLGVPNKPIKLNTRVVRGSSIFYKEEAKRESAKRKRKVGQEELFQQDFNNLAKQCNALHYHTYRSRYSPAGFPDNITLLPSGKLIISELKVKPNKISKEQTQWLEGWQKWFELAKVGGECAETYLWYPEDWQEILRVFEVHSL